MFIRTRSTSCSTRICAFALIQGKWRKVIVDRCKYFKFVFLICYALLRNLSRLFFSFKGFIFLLIRDVCSCEVKLFFINDIWGRCGHFNGYCVDIFYDFETYILRHFGFHSGENVSQSVDWTGDACYFKYILQHIITWILQCCRNFVCLGKTCDRFVCLSGQLLALLFSTKNVQTREMLRKLPKLLLNMWTFWVAIGRKFSSQRPRERTFSALPVSSDRDYLQLWGHIQHFYQLVSVIRTSCFPGVVCLSANLQGSLRAFLTESNVSFTFDVMLIGTSILCSL